VFFSFHAIPRWPLLRSRLWQFKGVIDACGEGCDAPGARDYSSAHKASFISVTQQFNSTTSMGHLTLNRLLSFAQFAVDFVDDDDGDFSGADLLQQRKRGLKTALHCLS
jgi:hypothetical protein